MAQNEQQSHGRPARAGDIVIIFSDHERSHVVSVVLTDADLSAGRQPGLVTSDSYHHAVDLARELAQGKPIFSLNADTGHWTALPHRHGA
jgi:hypothetical protein